MNTWAPLWSGIVESSLWEESGDVVKVFMTLLARKDADHICRLSAYKIHKLCNIDELDVLDILRVLASPDKRRREQQEFDGRRIEAVEDGWLILNGAKYRQMVSDEMRKARLRRAQANFREKKRREQEREQADGLSEAERTAVELEAHSEVASTGKANAAAVKKLNEIQRG